MEDSSQPLCLLPRLLSSEANYKIEIAASDSLKTAGGCCFQTRLCNLIVVSKLTKQILVSCRLSILISIERLNKVKLHRWIQLILEKRIVSVLKSVSSNWPTLVIAQTKDILLHLLLILVLQKSLTHYWIELLSLTDSTNCLLIGQSLKPSYPCQTSHLGITIGQRNSKVISTSCT